MKKEEDIIGHDFQGWPEYKMTLREILERLGLTKISNRGNEYWQIADNSPVLDVYPVTLEDDGMGYGVNAHFVTEVDTCSDEAKEGYVHMFIEKQETGH